MKRLFYFLLIVYMAILGVGCTPETDVDIVTTSFVGYDLAKNIVGDKLTVKNIRPLGGDLHNFEPTPKTIKGINYSRLFIFLSPELEPWIKDNVKQPNSLNLSESYDHDESHHKHEDHNFDHGIDDDHDHDNPHFWTDPIIYLQLLNVVRDRIIQIDPDNADYYNEKALAYYNEIYELHADFDSYMIGKWGSQIFLAAHNAMSYFGERYHLEIRSITKDYKPNADLTGPQLASLKEEIVANDIHYIFTEELAEPKVANKLKEILESQGYTLNLLELHGYHNISKKQFEEGITYADLFRQNIINIKRVLGN